MKLSFSGLENSLEIIPGRISILQIESVPLFSRICQSLLCSDGFQITESFSLWNEKGKEVLAKNTFLPIVNLFDLPWNDRSLVTALYKQIDFHMKEDDEVRQQIEAIHREFERLIGCLSLSLNANYSFDLEWSLSQSLKAYSFGINRDDSISLLDNLIRFIEFLHDICYKKVLLLVNPEKFLTENELLELEAQLFFHNLPALFLVQGSREIQLLNSQNLFVDQEFLEVLS